MNFIPGGFGDKHWLQEEPHACLSSRKERLYRDERNLLWKVYLELTEWFNPGEEINS
jgi:hypothetical protein